MPTPFPYFEGPVSDMADRVEGAACCSLCGKTGDCFELGSAHCASLSERDREAGRGCVECLRSGKFEFDHDTEYGLLEERGLRPYPRGHDPVPSGVPEAALTALRRTPPFTSWQGEHWLAHCRDFMAYLGTWEPEDFQRQAPDKDGRALFMAMTEPDLQNLWDASLPGLGGAADVLARHLLRLPVPALRHSQGKLGLRLVGR